MYRNNIAVYSDELVNLNNYLDKVPTALYNNCILRFLYPEFNHRECGLLFMDPYSWLLLLSCIVLLLFSAYFSATESAFAGVNRVRVKSLADNGDRRAKAALKISENFDKALTAILVGNNIVNIVCASVATILAIRIIGGVASGEQTGLNASLTTVTTLITTVLIFLFGEMIPKSLANADNDGLAIRLAPSLRVVMAILTPLTAIFLGISHLTRRICGGDSEPTMTEDELSTIIETVEEEGVIDEEQSDLLQSALEFSSTTVADVLTLWDDVSYVRLGAPAVETLELIRNTRHSRLPVLDGEEVVGILLIRNYLKSYITTGSADVRSLMTKPSFVRLDAVIDELLEQMSRNKCYLSVVRDKNDKVIGVVTIEDFLEELVGEIFDEDDEVNPDFMKLGGNYFEVSGALSMGELLDGMAYGGETAGIPRRKSLHTWLLERAGHVPEEGEEITCGDLLFTVDEVEDQRVSRVTVKLDTPELSFEEPESGTEPADEKEEEQ